MDAALDLSIAQGKAAFGTATPSTKETPKQQETAQNAPDDAPDIKQGDELEIEGEPYIVRSVQPNSESYLRVFLEDN